LKAATLTNAPAVKDVNFPYALDGRTTPSGNKSALVKELAVSCGSIGEGLDSSFGKPLNQAVKLYIWPDAR